MKKECDVCDFKTDVKEYRSNSLARYLCEICANSYSGIASEFPSQYPHSLPVLKMIAYVGNVILEELRKSK